MVLFFLSIFNAASQQMLTGNIVDSVSNEPIPYVSVLVKSIKEAYILNYSFTDEQGNYAIQLPEEVDSFQIETSIMTYLSKSEILITGKGQQNYTLNFNLEPRLNQLEEVYVEGKKKPITVKNDTTIYALTQFKDGSERVVEDLLKKLPGINIDANGEIKFKGKTVTRVLLDGDNIFNENYIIGTKNIDSDIVESVQAIEDYNENHLLKGIKSSDDVAVNLILKKGSVDVSGNAEIGLGIDAKKLFKANAISVSNKLKGFATLSYNNIGENYSSHNFLSNNIELSKINETEQRTSNLVNSNDFNSTISDNRISVNDNYVGSINALNKINKEISFRVNYNFFKDKLTRNENYFTQYNFDDESINIVNEQYSFTTPLINTLEYELIYKINKNSLLTSFGKWDLQNIEKPSFGSNNSVGFENFNSSRNEFFKNDLEYTYRINTKNVFQIFGNFSTNDIPQNVDNSFNGEMFNQEATFKKNYFKIQTSLLSKINRNELAFDLGYNFIENHITSNLQGVFAPNPYLENDIYYKAAKVYANFSYKFRINKWRFTSKLNANLYDINLNDANLKTNYQERFLNIQPKFIIQYYLDENSHIYTDYYLANQLPSANNVYTGLILINNRAITNNDFNFQLFNSHSVSLGYRINDFYNLFQFHVFSRFNYKKYGYIQQLKVDETTSFYTSIVDVTNNKNLDFGLEIEKYIHVLKSTININSNYAIMEYQNIINDSDLRKNKSKSLFGELDVRTGFKGNLNFESKLRINNNVFSNSDSNSERNSFTSFQTDFAAKYFRNNFEFTVNGQYFKPDLETNVSGDLFVDALFTYKSQSGKIEYQLQANNLLNNNIYRSINTSDFSSSVYEHNLQGRYLLLSVKFRF